MLTANKLEKIMELEDNLRAEYQDKLDARDAEIAQAREQLAEQKAQMQATIDQQLATLSELSRKASVNENFEQQIRELTNRSENQQDEITTLKKRVKTLQKDLAEERTTVKELTRYDPARMKKNLDASKKKLAEKTNANDLLQKSLSKTKGEKATLERQVKELESKLEELQSVLEDEKESEAA
ncbi:MAG: hypothetical protein Hals2KO_27800 [Halioglobus sp.]